MCKDGEHKLVYLETVKYRESCGYCKFTRIDRFYCKKCGEIINKKKTGYARCGSELDWY